MILAVFLSVSAVCASDVNQTDDTITTDYESSVIAEEGKVSGDFQEAVNTSYKTSSGDVFIVNTDYDFKLKYDNGTGIAHKTVQVTVNGAVSNYTTSKNGHVYVNLPKTGVCTLNFLFNESGYVPLKVSKTVTVVKNSVSTLKGSDYVAYKGFYNPFTVQLTTGGVNLANKRIIFKINGQKFVKYTDSNGKATLKIKMAAGKYKIKYIFYGTNNADSAYGKVKLTVIKGMPVILKKQSSLGFVEKKTHTLKFKCVDARGNPVVGKAITLKVDGKSYTKTTSKYGNVNFYITKNMGVYQASVSFSGDQFYKKVSNNYKLWVKPSFTINGGFWLFGSDMKSVNLKNMAKNGVNQIFLNYYAVTLHGKDGVAKFATEADKYGINVHIWMLTFYDGSWISPVTSSGKYRYSLFNSIIKEAKSYASIEGIDGIHFDYIRFPGNAYQYKNGAAAINYFTKLAANELHKSYPGIVVSAAVMAEPGAMTYYYGQDIPTMSKYLDVIIPMVYKGNYNSGTSWLKSTTAAFVKMSNGAEIWTGLQGYYSDSNVAKLPTSTISNDARQALYRGAHGAIVFRYSLFNMFNFSNLI